MVLQWILLSSNETFKIFNVEKVRHLKKTCWVNYIIWHRMLAKIEKMAGRLLNFGKYCPVRKRRKGAPSSIPGEGNSAPSCLWSQASPCHHSLPPQHPYHSILSIPIIPISTPLTPHQHPPHSPSASPSLPPQHPHCSPSAPPSRFCPWEPGMLRAPCDRMGRKGPNAWASGSKTHCTLMTSSSADLHSTASDTSTTEPSSWTATTLTGTETAFPVRMAVFRTSESCARKKRTRVSRRHAH